MTSTHFSKFDPSTVDKRYHPHSIRVSHYVIMLFRGRHHTHQPPNFSMFDRFIDLRRCTFQIEVSVVEYRFFPNTLTSCQSILSSSMTEWGVSLFLGMLHELVNNWPLCLHRVYFHRQSRKTYIPGMKILSQTGTIFYRNYRQIWEFWKTKIYCKL